MNPTRLIHICCALSLLLLGQSEAVRLVFSPTLLTINPARTLTTSTSVQNQDTAPVEFTAEVMIWTQRDGKDILEPTRDALVNPPRFVVAPGVSQTIRVGLRARSSTPETTYRLVVTALPKAAAPTTSGTDNTIKTSVLARYVFSLPLFVTTPGATSTVKTSVQRTPEGLTLKFTNTGTAAAILRNVKLQVGTEVLQVGGAYVLAGSSVSLPLPQRDFSQTGLSLSFDDRGQEHHERLDLPTS